MKLNLASGTDLKHSPWINLDIVPQWPGANRGCEVIWDARKDKIPFTDNSADEVYASYLLLHLAPRYHIPVLNEIYRVLQPGGTLIVGEVDMKEVMTRYLINPFDHSLSDLIWGEQGDRPEWTDNNGNQLEDYDKHCRGFTQETLVKLLSDHGFVNFSRIKIHEVFYELTMACQKGTII